jgi:hypothetical protein
MDQPVGVNMAGDVMHADERNLQRAGERFCRDNPDEQRADQAGSMRHGDRGQVG